MSKELTIKPNNNFGIEPVTWSILTNSIYTLAKPESIKMAYEYCVGKNIDPLKQYVHIVPMWNASAGGFKDVIMPGIGLYRHLAHATGQYAGLSAPEYGPLITENLGGVEVTYPEWCKLTVKKLMGNNFVAEFTAVEYWKENYATQKKQSVVPNMIWNKRVYGMLAKCTEAQALKKAFEEIPAEPTMEEMSEKIFDNIRDVTNTEVRKQLDEIQKKLTDDETDIITTEVKTDRSPLTQLLSLIAKYNIPSNVIEKWCNSAKVDSIAKFTSDQIEKSIIFVENQYGKYAE